ncbi:MAG: hypothetical protein A2087_12940 [Spirochaetes bacterium GWD1_61_31]|nr:MAG: hypothetical protein A2Y37_05595 [Spirochaetes bacterium GWB1_60_80]OHD34391.1 MAG: hypothetical protein A2004_06950 [Spirochaetes bacterium GWC1_61_12]OHD35621.1 MAG: hypothetical protein A2087_12940 [Spirochaetes bacterium GWD1_61_31]OHD41659.1 MAG: hypothetical protein A2Y35_08955 [Spirochaetes bacterium GWE1_60_18]OHD61680.1 MAG: hypothetical protein A2Y32_03055 [Spirochaetes bacterium GWF1_60_12]HAP42901.1 competence protein ComFB [Spirochaetaceae bacterium]
MEIHNLMEDMVRSTVDELFDADKPGQPSWCTCQQCRMDVACYVLNRMKPEYVVSSRGVAHAEQDYNEKLQRLADVVSTVREGWARINATRRPHFDHTSVAPVISLPDGPVYNIPPIMGRLFDGATFAPIDNLAVSLLDEKGQLVPMMDGNWQNPCPLVKNTGGTFIFWTYPVLATSERPERLFTFRVSAQAEGYDELSHFVELRLAVENKAQDQFSMQAVYKLPDMYLFPPTKDEDLESE